MKTGGSDPTMPVLRKPSPSHLPPSMVMGLPLSGGGKPKASGGGSNPAGPRALRLNWRLPSGSGEAITASAGVLLKVTEWKAKIDQVTVPPTGIDRKSTRLNSSHLVISYAVFCLKKK